MRLRWHVLAYHGAVEHALSTMDRLPDLGAFEAYAQNEAHSAVLARTGCRYRFVQIFDVVWSFVTIETWAPSACWVLAHCLESLQSGKHFITEVLAARLLRESTVPEITECAHDLLDLEQGPRVLSFDLGDL